MPGTRKLGRDTAHRTAMLRGLVTFFLENGKIETTVTRAKEVRALAEKMITIAKQDNLHNKRLVMSFITKESVTNKLSQRRLHPHHQAGAPPRRRCRNGYPGAGLIES